MIHDAHMVVSGSPLSKIWRGLFSGKRRMEAARECVSFDGEPLDAGQLRQHAQMLADDWRLGAKGAPPRRAGFLRRRLEMNKALLEDVHGVFSGAVKAGRRITPAAECFLDSHHLILEQVTAAHRHLPKRYSRGLPRLETGPHAGHPRVYALALELVSRAHGRIDADSLRAFVAGFQSVHPLCLGELWAIPSMLRMALLDALRSVAVRVAAGGRDEADHALIRQVIGSLRFLGGADWRRFVEETSRMEEILRTDPSGTYPLMDFATRDWYRRTAETLAKSGAKTEEELVRLAVAMAGAHAPTEPADADGTVLKDNRRHVGYFLVGKGRRALEQAAGVGPVAGRWLRLLAGRFPLLFYGGAILLLTALLAGYALWWVDRHLYMHSVLPGVALLLVLGASQLAVALIHWGATLAIRPRILPRLDFSAGIPPQHRTIVAVPAMLSDLQEVDHLVDLLEVRFLANRSQNLSFALLTDFPDAREERTPADAPLLARAAGAIAALNAKHAGGHFFLFHRPRRWNPGENAWMGWERKRGKLEDFNGALCGETGRFDTVVGDTARLEGVRYVITLDSDTQLPRDAAKQLVGAMAHPLNRPVYDHAQGRVTEGYGILQPRVDIGMQSANRSPFAGLFSGDPGIDQYTHAVSDVYQDLFDEGSFVGKGIYDLAAFRQALHGRLPDNRVLSHDLLESGHARSGLLSDVVLIEDYPSAYPAEMSRCSRWIRGDWQIAAWLFSRVPAADGAWGRNPLSAVSQWKVFDNLRRSLVPSALLALLVLGWFSRKCAAQGTVAVVMVMLLPALCHSMAQWARKPADRPLGPHARLVGQSLLRQTLRQAFLLACLPYEAFMNLDAIARACVRTLVTRRNMLEWRTARDAERATLTGFAKYYAKMWPAPVLAFAVWAALGCARPGSMPVAAPVLWLWLAAPALAFLLSQPAAPENPRLSAADRSFLWMTARRTWRFFEVFVGEGDHHLPPDNYQETPPRVAHRTSPTNIGLSLLANLAAHDFGFIPASEVASRTARALDTLEGLERHRGHFYNWYDTQTLAPLPPRYVSTVDSGNLFGHLRVMAAGLEELAQAAGSPRLPAVWAGLRATLDLVLDAARAPSAAPWADQVSPLRNLRKRLSADPVDVGAARRLLRQTAEAAARLVAAQGAGADPELKEWSEALAKQCWLAEQDLTGPDPAALAARQAALRLLAARCGALADAAEYGFLYNRERHLLSIGYDAGTGRLDAACYDLLASEARLASFTAIAEDKLPQENWFKLGRPVTHASGGLVLLSWSGSMFEYLMPLLVMPTCRHALLDDTYHAVVKTQIAYGRERGVPWGISESGYTGTDAQQNYQYWAFGVPGLGLKRGLADELVVAPYASVMALMVDPEAACANLRRLAREGRLGMLGFYEAVDYAPARLSRGQASAVVRSYMAHHQGMAFLSLAYVLLDQPMQRRFLAVPAFRATALLLEERAPKMPAVFVHPDETKPATAKAAQGDEGDPAPVG